MKTLLWRKENEENRWQEVQDEGEDKKDSDDNLMLILPDIGDSDSSKLRVREPEEEAAVFPGLEELVRPLLGDEAHDVALAPGAAHVVTGEGGVRWD